MGIVYFLWASAIVAIAFYLWNMHHYNNVLRDNQTEDA